ncbi:MAG: zinc finger domain protein, partial [Caulobacter sp.]|nr:zinc finger domain protein [Caulobacter sp.]
MTGRFDIAAVRAFVGERPFAAGESYAAEGRVELIAVEDDGLSAHVIGGEDTYLVELRGWSGEGGCTCLAYDKFGPCKHMAAAALAFNAMDPQSLAKVRGRLSRLR